MFREKVLSKMEYSKQSAAAGGTGKHTKCQEQPEIFTATLPEQLPVFRVPAFEKNINDTAAVKQLDINMAVSQMKYDDSAVGKSNADMQAIQKERNRKRKLKKKRHKERLRQQQETANETADATEKTHASRAPPFIFDGIF